MGDTETIKQCRVDIYLPSLEAKGRWWKIAEHSGVNLSKFIIHVVEESIYDDGGRLEPQRILEEDEILRNHLQKAEE